MINDDPQNPKKAYSDAEREQANRHHKDTLQSRFNDKRRSKQIVVQQRLHANDLTGALKDAGYKQIIIPVQNVTKKPLTYIFPISGKKVVIKPGAYLSERFTEAEVIETKKDMSADQYNAQYLQSPQAPGGAIVKSKHIRHWISEPKVEDSWQFVHSIDCTFKGEGQGKKPDYVALQTWAFKGSQKLLVRRAKGKWGITQTIKMMCDFVLNCPEYVAFLIEDKANGPAILELIGKSVERLIPINPKDSKIERLVSIVPDIEAGNVLLPPLEANPWLEKEYIPELVGFPNVSHDDEVDCTTQAVSYIKNITKGNIEDLVTGLNGLFG